jgi:uncharacterized membrane protein
MENRNFFFRNFKAITLGGLVTPIVFFSFISSYHLVDFFQLTNPFFLSVIIAIVLELTQLASIAGLAVLDKINGNVLYSTFFFIVIIQFFGNIFYGFNFASQEMMQNPEHLKNWSDLIGFQYTSDTTIKRVLTTISNGFFPVLSLAFTHLLFNYVNNINNDFPDSEYIVNEGEGTGFQSEPQEEVKNSQGETDDNFKKKE